MLRSLRVRLLVTLMSVVGIALGTVGLYTSRTTMRAFERYLERDVQRNQQVFQTIQTFFAQDEAERDVGMLAQQMAQILGERFILTDTAGLVLADSAGELIGQRLNDPSTVTAAVFIVGQPTTELGPEPTHESLSPSVVGAAGDQLYYSIPLSEPFVTNNEVGIVGAAPPVLARRAEGRLSDPIGAAFIDTVNRSLLLAVAAAGGAALILTIALGRRILQPVATLTAAARKLERGDLHERVPVRSRDELGVLGQAFNAMADGLARQEELRRSLVSDVAHELRTPLTNIRGYLEAVRDGVAEPNPALINSLHEEALLLNRLVDDLQELALAEAGHLRLDCQPVAIGEIVQRVVRAMQPTISVKGLKITTNLSRDLPFIQADAERIGQVVRNLLSNAVTHTPPGGAIGIDVTTDETVIVLSVRDTGAGIAAEHLPYIWDRFFRADPSRARTTGGAGLGLAIVKQLVQAHGGSVAVSSRLNEGTTFTVRLPIT